MTSQSKKISNDQELIQSDPTSCPQNQKAGFKLSGLMLALLLLVDSHDTPFTWLAWLKINEIMLMGCKVKNKYKNLTIMLIYDGVAEWLRPLIVSNVGNLNCSSHPCGFELSLGHVRQANRFFLGDLSFEPHLTIDLAQNEWNNLDGP